MTRPLSAGALALALGLACSAEERTLAFDPVWDAAALASGLTAAAGAHFLLEEDPAAFVRPDAGRLSGLDALTCLPYDEGKSRLSLAATAAAVAWPALFAAAAEPGELVPAAACAVEALAWTFAAKDCLKRAFPTPRPYAYRADSLSGEPLEEAYESFPSGHAALAFCGATTFAVLAADLAGDRPETPWLVAGGYAAACAAGALRVAAGEHFIGDVAAGALLGSAVGFAVASLHIADRRDAAPGAGAGARGLAASIRTPPDAALILRLEL